MHSAVWAAAAVWAAVASEVVAASTLARQWDLAASTPALQWAELEDLRLHGHLLLPAHLRRDHLLPGLSLLAPSLREHLPPEHLRRGHLLPQERTYSRIPLEALFRSQAGQTGLYASATDSSLTTGSSSITDFLCAGALVASRHFSLIADFSLVTRSSAGHLSAVLLLPHPSGILSMMDTRQTITRRLQRPWLKAVITAATLNSLPMSST